MWTGILFFGGACFLAWSVFTYYHSTDATLSVSRRMLAAVMAGAAAIGGAVMGWFSAP